MNTVKAVMCGLIAGLCLWSTTAKAGETVIPISGPVPADGPDHFFVEFEVPPGCVEVEVRHAAGSQSDVLDWGLEDPNGSRGWGGGNAEPAIVSADAASRSYRTGEVTPGTWRVIVGKANVQSDPATYDIEVVLRDTVTLPAQPQREAYADPGPLRVEPRWYAGDLHVHSRESGDARPDLDEVASFARGRGLDFVALSDHNTDTTAEFIVDAQSRHPELLLMPSVEWTSYDGHANAFGTTAWVDHKIGQPGVDITSVADAYHAQGALFSVNHPALDIGTLCIGCAWNHDLDPSKIDAVEIATGGLEPFGMSFSQPAIDFWDDLCDMGFHVAAVGGSDDHKAGVDLNQFQSPIGDATTMVFASELSTPALIEGIRNGRTVVKLQGVDDPMVQLRGADIASDTATGDLVSLTAEVHDAAGESLRIVVDGSEVQAVAVDSDDFAYSFELQASPDYEVRVRAELWVGGRRRVVTSHVWLNYEPDGGESSDTGTEASEASEASTTAASDDGAGSGCACSTQDESPPAHVAHFALVGLLGWVGRRRRRDGAKTR